MACTMDTNKLRIINLAAFIFNLVGVYLGRFHVYGKTNEEISDKYPSLFTPTDKTFAIWIAIFVLQGIYVVCALSKRLIPSFIVGRIVNVWFAWINILQPLWQIAFAQEWLCTSTVLIALAWACSGAIMHNMIMYRNKNAWNGNIHMPQLWQRAVTALPLSLHYAWISLAMFANLNVFLSKCAVKYNKPYLYLVGWGIALVGMGGISVLHTLTHNAAPIVTLVAAYGLAGIQKKLMYKNLDPILVALFDRLTISGLRHCIMVLKWAMIAMAVVALIRNLLWYFKWAPAIARERGLNEMVFSMSGPKVLGLERMWACDKCGVDSESPITSDIPANHGHGGRRNTNLITGVHQPGDEMHI